MEKSDFYHQPFNKHRNKLQQFTGLAFLTAFVDNLSQLYHAPWIDAIRVTTIGHIILGYSFSWLDILAYAAGILTGIIMESLISGTKLNKSPGTL